MILLCLSSQVFVALQLFVMQSTLAAFVFGSAPQRCARLEEDASVEWRRAQTARLLLPWPRVGRPSRRSDCRESVSVSSSTQWTGVGNRCSSRWEQSQAAETAGDEPAAAGDGAGDDKPAERRSGSAPSPASSPTGQWRTACTAPLLSFKTHTHPHVSAATVLACSASVFFWSGTARARSFCTHQRSRLTNIAICQHLICAD